jgi:hypothetical protein
MRGDFGTFDFTEMTDDEIYDLVVQHLGEYPELDVGWIDVAVRNGHVTLSGRVASDGEVQIAEKAVLDVLGLAQESFTNDLVVDELHRGELSEAADDAAAEEMEADEQFGSADSSQSDTAEHLVEDLDALTYGTRDTGAAVQEGASYEPPDPPVPDGYGSREAH